MKRAVKPFGNATVQLRLLTSADLELTLGWRNRDDARIWFKNSGILTLDKHRAWFEQYAERDDDFIFVVEADRKPVGQASVYRVDWRGGTAEVGRFLAAPEARGRGYIGQACAELVRFCAASLGLNSIYLEVKENNERAIRIYRRNGFEETNRSEGIIEMSRSLREVRERSADATGTSTVRG